MFVSITMLTINYFKYTCGYLIVYNYIHVFLLISDYTHYWHTFYRKYMLYRH